jgi:putative inorganic carbon (HCO3(-)) transporter
MLVSSRIGVTPILELATSDSSIGGLGERLDIWSRSIFMIQDFPFTGIGMGTFTEVADSLYPFSLALPGTINHAHNLFLQIAVDLGVLGLIAWMAILFTILALSWQLYRSKTSLMQSSIAGIGAGLLCSQLALILHGLTDAVTWGMVRPAPLVWALWGLAVAAWSIDHSSSRTN